MTELAAKGRFPHILRVIICLMTFGFAFPHALMENIDAARLLAKEEVKKDLTRKP